MKKIWYGPYRMDLMIWAISYGPYHMGHVVFNSFWKMCFDTILWSLFSGRQESRKPTRPIVRNWLVCQQRNSCKGMNEKKVDFKDENDLIVGFLSIAIKHFLPRLGKNILRKVLVLVIKRVTKTDTISASISFYARVQRFDYISRWLFLIKIHPYLYTLQVYRFNLGLRFRVQVYIWLFFVYEIRYHQIN